MLPILPKNNQSHLLQKFISQLKSNGFLGDAHDDLGSLVSVSTDNSIYQVTPELVLYPKNKSDILKIFKLGNINEFKCLKFSPRGGGTGTNGQSLSAGIIIDCSRFMNNIIEFNQQEKWITVQPAVVLDQLNEHIQKSKLFFAPNLSPSNRATLGGMVNTDACGKGSRIYGKTSQHILEIDFITVCGSEITSKKINFKDLEEKINQQDKEGEIYRATNSIISNNLDEIDKQFPKIARFMTGYNLAKVIDSKNKTFNINYLLSGSEGTLVYVVGLKLNLVNVPKYKSLFALQYPTFEGALRSAKALLDHHPAAVETVDDNILTLAKEDEIYNSVRHMIVEPDNKKTGAINLVEIISDTAEGLIQQEEEIKLKLDQLIINDLLNAYYHTNQSSEINALWNLRKKGVGLLGNMKGENKPVPFMEDTAVPPENLADYIVDLRKLLDSYNLKYGMFGHVDVGCLHMRPALDMTTKAHQDLIPELTKKVNDLVRKYGGVYWSEHGKGFRSEYVQQYFGDKLYSKLAEIKQVFDQNNRMNPGKIVVPKDSKDKLVKVDGPYKGLLDAKIDSKDKRKYAGAFNCNGNAACLNYSYDDVICPSAKLSRNWVHSPKGRSGLLREWLHQLADKKYTGTLVHGEINYTHQLKSIFKDKTENDFSHEVYASMEKCLGCKACSSSCPVKVDIPTMRAHFLSQYHTRYARPVKDYFIAIIEKIAYYQSYLPKFFNQLNQNRLVKYVMNKYVGLCDLPQLSETRLKDELTKRLAPEFDMDILECLTENEKLKTLCLVQDSFTSFYQNNVVLDTYDLLIKLGFTVYVLPFMENGKGLHNKGFLKKFDELAKRNTIFYNKIAALNIPMVGVEPSMVLCYRDEYVKTLAGFVKFKVHLINEWLSDNLDQIDIQAKHQNANQEYSLYLHCSEKALALNSSQAWRNIFDKTGIKISLAQTGCCGMAGTYGHEVKNIQGSKSLYKMSWQGKLDKSKISENVLVTGFSCRSQIKRMAQEQAQHPISVLNGLI